MRKRIFRISEDKFDDPKPNIEFAKSEILESCYVGESFKGELCFKSTNGEVLRGLIYSSNPYVTVLNPSFDGLDVTINYEIKDRFFKPNDVVSGHFTVVVFGSETTIPFTISYTHSPLKTSVGIINSLEDFTAFAQAHFNEAVRLFYSEDFSRFIKSQPVEYQRIYRGFKYASVSSVNVDEFLVSCKMKDRMSFDMEEKTDSFYGIKENVRGDIEITRNTWGFIEIDVTCDSDFIAVDRQKITADFFLGSVFTMHYYVHKDKLHAGINLAKISFDYRNVHKELHVIASVDEEGQVKVRPVHDKNRVILELCRKYEAFRLRQLSVGQWCEDTINLLDTLETMGYDENFIMLYKAQAYITNKQKQEALWIIQDLKRTINDKRSAQWAYLLYLCTLIEREETYVDRITEDIESIYRDHSKDIRIFWFLLFLRREYVKNPTAKLRAIAEWVMAGYNTPFLLVEAYYVLLQDPYLVNSFDEFTIKVLTWAMRHGALTKELSVQMVHVIENSKVFNPKAFAILEECYRLYPDLQLLLSMVTYLIRGGASDARYFYWYKLAIDNNLHVAGIFEAYINTMPDECVDRLPQLVTMFFRYNNNLSYEKKALLYANIILHKDEDKDTYEQYERTIEKFIIEQMKLGHIDDNLAICYQELLNIGIIDDGIASILSSYIFRKKIICFYPNVRRILLFQDEFTNPTIVPVINQQAYVLYIASVGTVFLEDTDGRLICDDTGYRIDEIMDPTGYIGKLRSLAPVTLPFILEDFAGKKNPEDFNDADINAIELLVHAPEISNEYKQVRYSAFIQFLQSRMKEAVLESHFKKEADLTALDAKTLSYVIEVFVSSGQYDSAYYLMTNLNCQLCAPETRKLICHHMIRNKEFALDDYLVSMAAQLVDEGFFTDSMISYLTKFYIGPTELMVRIYKLGTEAGIDLVEFAERIIMQSLYADTVLPECHNIFEHYITRKNNRMIVDAFLTKAAHEYLAYDTPTDERIFSYIFSRYLKGRQLNDSMRIALMKRLCIAGELDDKEYEVLNSLLAEALFKNQYFGFYSSMDNRLLVKFHLYDKKFVEYRGEHRKAVVIVHSLNGEDPIEEDMIEMYDGLYVKQFVMFFGDTLKYEIYCDELSVDALATDEIVLSDSIESQGNGRFDLMNSMNRSLMYYDEAELLSQMKRYQGLDVVTKQIFTIV